MNEPGVGKAIKASGIPRDQIFITTKVWPGNPAWGQPAKSYDDTLASCKASLEKLGVEQVDLYLIHTPLGGGKEGRLAQYRGLVECQKLGMCTSIGVSNFSVQHLQELEEAGLPTPAANQLELHPNSQKQELRQFMQKKNIQPIAYSSLAPMATWREGYAQFGGTRTPEEKAATSCTSTIAAGLGVSEPKLLLCYGVQKGWCVLPKSINEARIAENFDIGSFTIPEDVMKQLDARPQEPPLAFGSPGQPMDPSQCP
jgi:2,5-diketo-D-gluconate reductase A